MSSVLGIRSPTGRKMHAPKYNALRHKHIDTPQNVCYYLPTVR